MKDVKVKEKNKGDFDYVKKLKKKTRMLMYSSQQLLMRSSTMLLMERFFTYPTLNKVYF
jgi:hypothetical protein